MRFLFAFFNRRPQSTSDGDLLLSVYPLLRAYLISALDPPKAFFFDELKIQWNLSIADMLYSGHLSIADAFSRN